MAQWLRYAATALATAGLTAQAGATPALQDLCRQAGGCAATPFAAISAQRALPPGGAGSPRKACPKDWNASRTGDCWTKTSIFGGPETESYVHPRGWTVDARCFSDPRFPNGQIIAALDSAWRKMSPGVSTTRGGCLSEFNPAWGRELVDSIWTKRMHVSCGGYDPAQDTCAHHESRDGHINLPDGRVRMQAGYYHLLAIGNVGRCMGHESSGLAGVLFHESLHAAGADNFAVEKHNKAWELEQYVFVYDRVYGTEAVCFFGVDPGLRRFVNIIQCRTAVSYNAAEPRLDLCRGFDASFTNLRPLGFLKH